MTIKHHKLGYETSFSYTLSDWFNKWYNIPTDQSAGSSHGVNFLLLTSTPWISAFTRGHETRHDINPHIPTDSLWFHHLYSAWLVNEGSRFIILTSMCNFSSCLSSFIHHSQAIILFLPTEQHILNLGQSKRLFVVCKGS